MKTLWLLYLVAAFLVADFSQAWLFSRSRSFPHDIRTQSGLTSLYNQRVSHVEHVERPIGRWPMVGPLRHSGVVVTTENGGRWLVHKGGGYGRSSQTVVTDAPHMSNRWQSRGGQDVSSSRVGDYVRAGGASYNLCTDNCHNGRQRMLDLP